MATLTVDLEHELILNNTAAMNEASSDLKSLERLRLDELTPEQVRMIAASGDFRTIDYRNREVGLRVRSFHQFMATHAPLVSAMRDIMRPRRGSHKRTKVVIEGVEQEVTWGQYCLKVYGVGHDWVNRLLNGEHTQDSPDLSEQNEDEVSNTENVEQTIEPKLSKKDLTIVALQKKNDELLKQVEELVYTLSHPDTPEITSVHDAILASAVAKHETQVAAELTYDPDFESFDFVLEHFQPITTPLSFASELDRIIRACNMQAHVRTVLVEEEQPATQEAL